MLIIMRSEANALQRRRVRSTAEGILRLHSRQHCVAVTRGRQCRHRRRPGDLVTRITCLFKITAAKTLKTNFEVYGFTLSLTGGAAETRKT